jgi:hypothetical protein
VGTLGTACRHEEHIEAAQPAAATKSGAQGVARDTPLVAEDRYDLERDERRGGHTLARHIGRTDEQLLERLRRERQVSAASTYTDQRTAERVVAKTLAQNRARLDRWLDREGSRPNLALDYHGVRGDTIGRSLKRGAQRSVSCADAVVVLRWDRGRNFYVLTTYPEADR